MAYVIEHWEPVTGGLRGMSVPQPEFFGVSLADSYVLYYASLGVLAAGLFAAANLLRSPMGRAFVAVRDSEISAESMGVHLARTKTIAFAVSAAFTGLAGVLLAHRIGYLAPDAFTVQTSIQLLLLVVVGGLGSLHGVVFGAIFVGYLPQVIALARDLLPSTVGQIPGLELGGLRLDPGPVPRFRTLGSLWPLAQDPILAEPVPAVPEGNDTSARKPI